MSLNKLITIKEAVSRFTADGIQYASGAALPVGSDAIAFGRELLRQKRKGLHALFHCNSQQLNLLAAAGAVDKAECGFSGLEVFGFANGLRRAVESGRLALEDYSNLSMALRFLGGALNWPFVPTTVNVGSDIAWRSAFAPDVYPAERKIPAISDPFTGRRLGALSPLRPDLAAIHVTLSDPEGNAIILGTEWSRVEISRAAKKVVLV
ncbi:MAG: CoA transferase subunit A, partial [Candidatus Accumulibacter sp.]|nr:CoA transferase subunit A [Accumulibacter sp.]